MKFFLSLWERIEVWAYSARRFPSPFPLPRGEGYKVSIPNRFPQSSHVKRQNYVDISFEFKVADLDHAKSSDMGLQ